MENKDFVAQLAQFSSLEQLLNVNSNLQANFLVMQSLNNSSVASFIGKSVKADGNSVYLKDEGDAVLNYKLDSSAKVTVKIYDESGNIVRTISDDSWQDSGDRELAWDGCDSSGNRLSAGKYTFEVSATDANGDSVGVTTYVKGKITGVKFDNGVAVLLMDGLEVRLSDILEISE
jgi:flagellar basal-body rod modification protein FlgD